jgi:hypothetical protein
MAVTIASTADSQTFRTWRTNRILGGNHRDHQRHAFLMVIITSVERKSSLCQCRLCHNISGLASIKAETCRHTSTTATTTTYHTVAFLLFLSLGLGWKKFYDELSGQWYYVHAGSQKSTWVRPRPDDSGALALPRLTQTQRAFPRRRIDKPTTYTVSSTSVPDPKLCRVETTVAVGPLYPKRIVPLPAAARSPVGIPTVPSRVDPRGVYHPLEPTEESSHRVQSRWVNLPPPAPLVPVHRPAWDDRAFWALCGENAESAQRYEVADNQSCACLSTHKPLICLRWSKSSRIATLFCP